MKLKCNWNVNSRFLCYTVLVYGEKIVNYSTLMKQNWADSIGGASSRNARLIAIPVCLGPVNSPDVASCAFSGQLGRCAFNLTNLILPANERQVNSQPREHLAEWSADRKRGCSIPACQSGDCLAVVSTGHSPGPTSRPQLAYPPGRLVESFRKTPTPKLCSFRF